MSDYLDRLEHELVRAGYREPRRVWPTRAAVTLVTAAAAAFLVLALFGGPPPAERAAQAPDYAVDATFDGGLVEESNPPMLRVGLTAAESVQATIELDGATAVTTDVAPGAPRYFNLELPAGTAGFRVILTDDAGNQRTFDQPLLPPEDDGPNARPLSQEQVTAHFAALRGPDDLQADDGTSVEFGGEGVCIEPGRRAPVCWPLDDRLYVGRQEVLEDGLALALVPDDAFDARAIFADGHEEPAQIVDNVIAVRGAERLSWRVS